MEFHLIYTCTKNVWDEFLLSYHTSKYVYKKAEIKLYYHIICDTFVHDKMDNKENVNLYHILPDKDGSHHVVGQEELYRKIIDGKLNGCLMALNKIEMGACALVDTDTIFLAPFIPKIIERFSDSGPATTGAVFQQIGDDGRRRVGDYNGGVILFNAYRAREFVSEWRDLTLTRKYFYEQQPYSILANSSKWRGSFQIISHLNNLRECNVPRGHDWRGNPQSLFKIRDRKLHYRNHSISILHNHLINWEQDDGAREWGHTVVQQIIKNDVEVAPYLLTILRVKVSRNMKICDLYNRHGTHQIPQTLLKYQQTFGKPYPIHQSRAYSAIEWGFFKHVMDKNLSFDNIKYIPVQITNHLVDRHNQPSTQLKNVLERYDCGFVVVQHCNGIAIAPKNSKIYVFNAGGGGRTNGLTHIPIPLLNEPHLSKEERNNLDSIKRIHRVSFMGNIKTHPCRQTLELLFNDDDDDDDIYWSNTYGDYRSVMKQTVFALSPRGFGPTSFRLYEALEFGCIPVYIHDDDIWLPYKDEIDWSQLAILHHIKDMATLPKRLESISDEQITTMRKYASRIYDKYFTLDGLFKWMSIHISSYQV